MFGKLLTNQKIAHKIVKPYVYKALREGLKTHDNGKIQNLRGFDSLSLRKPGVPKCTKMLKTNVLGIFFCPNRCAKMLQNAPGSVWQPNPVPFFNLKMKSYFDQLVKIMQSLGL